MTTEAAIGHGTKVLIASVAAPLVYVEVGEVTSVTPPPMTRDIIDATHMASPNKWREFIAGLKDGGEMSLDINFVPGSSTTTLLVLMQTETEPRPVKIQFPNAEEWGFSAFCTGFEPSVPVADKMTASVKFTITGEPDFVDPS